MDKKSTHPFAPEIPEGATKLIIGTMPPYRFCNTDEMLYDDDVNFYYGSRDNYFWELVSDASGKRLTYANTQEAIDERKRLLADLHRHLSSPCCTAKTYKAASFVALTRILDLIQLCQLALANIQLSDQ